MCRNQIFQYSLRVTQGSCMLVEKISIPTLHCTLEKICHRSYSLLRCQHHQYYLTNRCLSMPQGQKRDDCDKTASWPLYDFYISPLIKLIIFSTAFFLFSVGMFTLFLAKSLITEQTVDQNLTQINNTMPCYFLTVHNEQNLLDNTNSNEKNELVKQIALNTSHLHPPKCSLLTPPSLGMIFETQVCCIMSGGYSHGSSYMLISNLYSL